MAETNIVLGGWSGFNFNLSAEAHNVFKAALEGFTGVSYTPLAVATQVVAGTNYCYLCKGEVIVPGLPQIAALVYIYQPLEGAPHITEISRINP